jgi:hypothetical protein
MMTKTAKRSNELVKNHNERKTMVCSHDNVLGIRFNLACCIFLAPSHQRVLSDDFFCLTAAYRHLKQNLSSEMSTKIKLNIISRLSFSVVRG